MVQAEYGWSDQQLLDTPVCRLRQIVAAVSERQRLDDLRNRGYIEWQTKTLGSLIASTAQTDDRGAAQLAKVVEGISLVDPKELGSMAPKASESNLSHEELVASAEERAAAKNAPGTFEQLARRAAQ